MAEEPTLDARIFFVETRFQQMARRPGGVPRERAIENAQARIDELKPVFPEWLERKLQEFVDAIREIEATSADSPELEHAFFQCCQLRDVGTTMGFELMTFIADIVCQHLEAIKAGSPYHKETMDCQVDALILASKAPYCNLQPHQLPEMTNGLRQVVERAKIQKAKRTD